MHILAIAVLVVLSMPFQSRAIECPKIPEQTNKDWEVAVKAAVVRIGPVKGAELETQTRKATVDLMGKLPQADKVYLEQMMYATYCSALRDDKTISESEKARRIRAYNLEVKKALGAAKGQKDSDKKRAPPTDGRIEARAQIARLSMPFTPQAFVNRIIQGDTDAVKLYLAADMSPDSADDESITALMHAVHEGRRTIIDLLLKARADVNKKNRGDGTAVSWALGLDKRDILRLLLDHGANRESLNRAFVSAAGEWDVDSLKMLVASGADIHATLDKKPIMDLALERAISFSPLDSKMDGQNTVEFLLDHGANVNTWFADGFEQITPLLLAASNSYVTIVRTLLERGADPNAKWDCGSCNYAGSSSLMIAVKNGADEMVEILISRKADVTIKNKKGQSLLQIAAHDGS